MTLVQLQVVVLAGRLLHRLSMLLEITNLFLLEVLLIEQAVYTLEMD